MIAIYFSRNYGFGSGHNPKNPDPQFFYSDQKKGRLLVNLDKYNISSGAYRSRGLFGYYPPLPFPLQLNTQQLNPTFYSLRARGPSHGGGGNMKLFRSLHEYQFDTSIFYPHPLGYWNYTSMLCYYPNYCVFSLKYFEF